MKPRDRAMPPADNREQQPVGGTLPVAQLRAFDEICDRLENAWRNGLEPVIEDFSLPQVAELSLSAHGLSELNKQLLEVEFEQRLSRGQTPRFSDYAGRFPGLADWLRRRLPADSTPSDESDFIGLTLGKYKIIQRLGAGGMGAVFRARHTMIHCERALKLLRPDLEVQPDAIKRFLTEAQACVELTHPNIVTTYHVDRDERGRIYLVMELLDGQNLYELVEDFGPLEIRQAAEIIQQAAAGLEFAHARGTVHRDIKPHNIMLTTDKVAKVLDFGLVRILEGGPLPHQNPDPLPTASANSLRSRFLTRFTNERDLLGTLPYMSPEQAADPRNADKQSDVYSLGCTFYYLLTGRHAFAGDTVEEILNKHQLADFTPAEELRPEIPPALVSILSRMMAADRERRFPSAQVGHSELSQWIATLDAGETQSSDQDFPPITLEDASSLREALLGLGVVSQEDWLTAQQQAELIQQRTDAAAAESQAPKVDDPTRPALLILEQLQTLRDPHGSGQHGLSEFQLRHVLNGDVDLLRLPNHVLHDQLGAGWKGGVFQARNLKADRTEVIRILSLRALCGLKGAGEQRIESYQAAAHQLLALRHPALPEYYEAGHFEHRLHGEMAFLSAYRVSGETIANLVDGGYHKGQSPLNPAMIVRIVRDACSALAYAHAAGVLHLDLHAGSLMLDGNEQLYLLDLGVAPLLTRHPDQADQAPSSSAWRSTLAASSDETKQAAVAARRRSRAAGGGFEPPPIGTSFVMPPEQWQNRGHTSVSTDIYNLGCTMFFMLAGRYPFEGKGALELMQMHLHKSPWRVEAAARIPKTLRPILDRALAKSPRDRFASAAEMAEALEELPASFSEREEAKPSWLLSRFSRFLTRRTD